MQGSRATVTPLSLVMLVCASGLLSELARADQPFTADEVRRHVAAEIGYSLDQEIQQRVEFDQAVRVDIRDNVYNVAEVLIYPRSDGQCWLFTLDRHGGILDRGMRSYRDFDGAFIQVGYFPLLELLKWRVDEGALVVDFLISSDRHKNREIRDQLLSGELKLASLTRLDNFYLPADLSEDERIVGFVHWWSEVKYNFAFFDQVPELDWDQVLVDYLPKIRAASSTYDFYDLLRQSAALLHDGHTAVWGPDERPRFSPRVRLQEINGKAIVQAVAAAETVRDPRLRGELEKAGLQRGEEILRVDGRSVEEILENDLYPRIAASTPQWRDLRAFPALLRGALGSKATLVVRSLEGKTRQVELTRTRVLPRPRGKGFVYEELANNLAYVNLPSFGSEAIVGRFEEILENILKARGLILDLRENGGGNSEIGYRIASYLIREPIPGSSWRTRQYRPAFRAWGEEEEWFTGEHPLIQPSEKANFEGPVVVLIEARTFSAAEDFVVALHAAGRATVVGRRTGGSTGQPLRIELPGGGGARICTKRDTYPNGGEFVGVGVVPDVEVPLNVDDLVAGHDPILERGIEVLGSLLSESTATSRAHHAAGG